MDALFDITMAMKENFPLNEWNGESSWFLYFGPSKFLILIVFSRYCWSPIYSIDLKKKKGCAYHEQEHMVDIMDVIDEGVEEIDIFFIMWKILFAIYVYISYLGHSFWYWHGLYCTNMTV